LGRDVVGLAPNETTIATVLREAGYRTAAFLAGNPYLGSRFGYHQGFDSFDDALEAPPAAADAVVQQNGSMSGLNRRLSEMVKTSRLAESAYNELYFWYCQWRSSRETVPVEKLRPYPAADEMVNRACSWLQENGNQDCFVWIHLMDTHHPHYPPQEALAALGTSVTVVRQRFVNSFWNRRDIEISRLKRYVPEMVPLYDASVRWVDQQIARLVGTLKELRLWNDTTFVLTADHGEEFLEHGDRYHSPTSPIEQLIRVPLLMHSPGIGPLASQRGPFSLVHLAPTLLDALGVRVPASFQGSSYWNQIVAGGLECAPAILETVGTGSGPCDRDQQMRPRLLTIRDQQYKLVLRFGAGTFEMFDLKNDPDERNLLQESALIEERSRLLQVANDHLRKTRLSRDKNLVLNARLRDIRHSMSP
jgi:arylsulfatase A-like enzyme